MNPKREPPPRPPLPANKTPSKASAPQETESEWNLSSSPGLEYVPMTNNDEGTHRMKTPAIRVSVGDTGETTGLSTGQSTGLSTGQSTGLYPGLSTGQSTGLYPELSAGQSTGLSTGLSSPVSDEELISDESCSDRSGGDSSSTDLNDSEDSASLFGAGLCTKCDDVLYHRSIFHSGDAVASLVSCERCGLLSTTKYEDDAGTSKSRVDAFKMLERADHVAWRRSSGAYWHHGIVEEVDGVIGQLLIINYNGEAVKRDGHYASVRREWVSTNLRKKNLYRIDYRPGKCFPADVVLDRAAGRLGEAKYNPFTENCEHFARWCKTGDHRSVQVETLPQRIKDAPELLRQNVSKEKALRAARRAVDKSCKTGKRLLQKGAKGVFSKVGTTVANKAPDMVDAMDRGMDRLRVGISRIEGIGRKQSALQSGDIKTVEVKKTTDTNDETSWKD